MIGIALGTTFLDRQFVTRLQDNPRDLRRMNAATAAHALFDFIQRVYGPGDECSIWSPQQAMELGDCSFWRVN